MADITFRVSESDEGSKLLLLFDYDERMIERVKSLPYPPTEYGFHYADDEESPLHGHVDDNTWFINHTVESLKALENNLNLTVPEEHWPEDNTPDNGDVDAITLQVNEDGTHFEVNPVTNRINTLLDNEFSYDVPGAEYTEQFQKGNWDGQQHLYKTKTRSAPIGLLNTTKSILETEGLSVNIQWMSKNKGDRISTSWCFPHGLRDYQRDAVGALINNNGGIVSLPTGTGKTITALRYIYEMNRRAIVFVHTRELLYQWATVIENTLDITPGVIGDDQWSEGPVTVASMQTLMSRGVDELEGNYGISIFDECHRTSAADVMHDIGMGIDTYYRVGLSATPWRRVDGEELKIRAAIKSVAFTASTQNMIQNGYLANPVFDLVDPADFGDNTMPRPNQEYPAVYRQCVEFNPARTRAVAAAAKELADDGHKVLVNVNRIPQGDLIAWTLNPAIDLDQTHQRLLDEDKTSRAQLLEKARERLEPMATTNAIMLSADAPDDVREQVLSEFENGDIDILVSTLLKEGVNIPEISAIVLAHGQKSDLETIQTIGRALRPTDDYAHIVDVVDHGKYVRDAYRERMKTITQYYELETAVNEDSVPLAAVPIDEDQLTPLSCSISSPLPKSPEQQTLEDVGV